MPSSAMPMPEHDKPTSHVQVTELGGTSRIDSAIADIYGRYPVSGSSVNQQSDMVIYVISGSGVIIVADERRVVVEGDVLTIEREAAYHYEPGTGGLRVFMASTPPWSPDQYETIG